MFLLFLLCGFTQEIHAKTYTSVTECTNEGSGYNTKCSESEIELGPLCPDPNNPSSCPLVCCGTQASKNLLDCKAVGGNYLGQCALGQEVAQIGGRGCCASAYTSDSCSAITGTVKPVSPGCDTNTDGLQIGKVCTNKNDNPASCTAVCCRKGGTNPNPPAEVKKLTDNQCADAGGSYGQCTPGGGICLPGTQEDLGLCTDAHAGLIGPKERRCCTSLDYTCTSNGGECKIPDGNCSVVSGGSCSDVAKFCCKKSSLDSSKLTDAQCNAKASGSRCSASGKSCVDMLDEKYVKNGECANGGECCTPNSSPDLVVPSQDSNAISSFAYNSLETLPGQGSATNLPSYLLALYNFGLGAVGIAALLMAIVGGYFYVTSAGNTSRVSKGKELITDAILGIVVAFCAWLLLYIINPDLVNVNLGSLLNLETKLPESTENGAKSQSPTQEALSSKGKAACQTQAFKDQVQASASKYNIDAKILQSVLVAGEGCNPNISPRGACGYGQEMPEIRSWCGITGSASETCTKVQNDTELSIDCAAKLIKDNNKLGCETDSCSEVARCYNAGWKKTCAQTENHYCDRVCSYYSS